MIFQSIKTSQLNKNTVNEILYLKDSHWKYGIKSQLNWYKKFTMDDDIHNLLLINDKIMGYTSLGTRSFEVIDSKKNKKKFKYLLFTTLVLHKKVRNFSYASKMMKFNNNIIKKNSMPSFLLCHNKIINFYKFFNWSKIDKSIFSVPDHESLLVGMIYNFKEFNKRDNFLFNFYYYS